MKKNIKDVELIDSLGGVSAVAELLGYSIQRVHNWTQRGIPASEKLKNPQIFLQNKNSEKAA
jgi:hypothetical protein